MTDTNSNPSQPPKRRGRRALIATGAIAAVLAAGAATHAFSHGGFGKSMRHLGVEASHYGGMIHKARWHRRPKTVEDAQKRAEKMAKHLAIEIEADDAQTGKLVEIARGMASDVFPIRKSLKELRKEAVDILSADTVDRAKLEALRAERFSKMEDVSKSVTVALADAAEVLNPEQRKEFAERVRMWRGFGGHHRRGGWHKKHRGDWEDRDERGEDRRD